MKTKLQITALTILCTLSFNLAQGGYQCSHGECTFQPGQQVYIFGNNVKLRTAPSAESKVLELLKIGEWVEVIEKTTFSWPYKGFDSPFYKVKYDDTTGYILGGLLATERKTLNGQNYFFAYSKEGDAIFLKYPECEKWRLCRAKDTVGPIQILTSKYLTTKGVPGLEGIMFIDYNAEACGVEGGGVYLFAHDGELTRVAALTLVSDAGVYYRSERFIFPTDVGGLPEKILLKKEQGEVFDESTHWTKTTVENKGIDMGRRAIDSRLRRTTTPIEKFRQYCLTAESVLIGSFTH